MHVDFQHCRTPLFAFRRQISAGKIQENLGCLIFTLPKSYKILNVITATLIYYRKIGIYIPKKGYLKMLTKIQLKILGAFRKDIFEKLDFKKIKDLSGQKSNSVIQAALAAFKGMNLVTPEKAGKSIFFSLNFHNILTLSYLSILSDIELRSNRMLPFGVLQTIQNGIQEYTPFFVLFVFGSYAKKRPRRESDLDIAVIVETDATRKEIVPSLETVKRRELLEIDYHIFTMGEFLEMLFDKQENLGKQIYRGSMIYYGAQQYYALLSENTRRIIL